VRVAGGAAVGLALLVRLVELVRLDAEVAGAGRHAEVRPYHAEYQRHLALIGAGVSARAGEAVRVAASGGLQRLRIGRPVPCRCRSQKQITSIRHQGDRARSVRKEDLVLCSHYDGEARHARSVETKMAVAAAAAARHVARSSWFGSLAWPGRSVTDYTRVKIVTAPEFIEFRELQGNVRVTRA